MSDQKFIFTITAGRTGTAWLSKFIELNSLYESIHEPLGINDFGSSMPDVKTMRSFNDIGLNDNVIHFWNKKFDALNDIKYYAESNHTLSKCGLIEFMDQFTEIQKNASIVILKRRSRINQAVSYLTRNDFLHVTLHWQWYLSYKYKRKIINSAPFLEHGLIGMIYWYIYEMESRQEYYKTLFGERFNFIDATLEDIVTPEGARTLGSSLSFGQELDLPPPKNANKLSPSFEMIKRATDFDSMCQINPKDIAEEFIKSGDRLAFIS